MNKNFPKRKIVVEDALDLFIEDNEKEKSKIVELDINSLESYHNHPFKLYEGKRLQDMVESIKENGILTPITVQEKENGKYEILAGHNRVNAARQSEIDLIPCIIKENLTEKEAYTYVIETNLMQRSFSDLLPTEKAIVLKMRYEKIASQGKRNDLQKEMRKLDDGIIEKEVQADDKTTDSRKKLGKEYNLSGASVARYLRLNYLTEKWQQAIDSDEISLTMAVDLSYLSSEIQDYLYQQCKDLEISLKPSDIKTLHLLDKEKDLDTQLIQRYLAELKTPKVKEYQNIKLSQKTYQKFFKNEDKEKAEEIIEKALNMYFESQNLK